MRRQLAEFESVRSDRGGSVGLHVTSARRDFGTVRSNWSHESLNRVVRGSARCRRRHGSLHGSHRGYFGSLCEVYSNGTPRRSNSIEQQRSELPQPLPRPLHAGFHGGSRKIERARELYLRNAGEFHLLQCCSVCVGQHRNQWPHASRQCVRRIAWVAGGDIVRSHARGRRAVATRLPKSVHNGVPSCREDPRGEPV